MHERDNENSPLAILRLGKEIGQLLLWQRAMQTARVLGRLTGYQDTAEAPEVVEGGTQFGDGRITVVPAAGRDVDNSGPAAAFLHGEAWQGLEVVADISKASNDQESQAAAEAADIHRQGRFSRGVDAEALRRRVTQPYN